MNVRLTKSLRLLQRAVFLVTVLISSTFLQKYTCPQYVSTSTSLCESLCSIIQKAIHIKLILEETAIKGESIGENNIV